jgi:hypothetical protein
MVIVRCQLAQEGWREGKHWDAEGYDVKRPYYNAYILFLLPRLPGVGQAIAESISCLLPEMAVAMPKILHLPIFGILRQLRARLELLAFCLCLPSAVSLKKEYVVWWRART